MMRFSPQVRDLNWMLARPITHRGLHDEARGVVENTSSAFAAAMAKNYAIECDLVVSADGEALVFHDDTLNRVMTTTGLVKSHSTREIKKMTFQKGKDRIQTLGEMLDQVDGKVALVIELKPQWDQDLTLALRTIKVLASYKGPYSLMSFDPDVMAAIAEISPHTVRGIVAEKYFHPEYNLLAVSRRHQLRTFAHLGATKPHFMSFNQAELPYWPLQNIRAAGFPVITWTIRSPEQASRALRYCDQITFEGFSP